MMSASLIGAGKILDSVELLMMAGCVAEAIGQLLDAGHFILARQILSTIDDKAEELDDLTAKVEAKWVTEALKVNFEKAVEFVIYEILRTTRVPQQKR